MQRVSEEMWKKRSTRFPSHTPTTKEYYLLRSIFEEHYPSASALHTVPTVQPALVPPYRAASYGPMLVNSNHYVL